MKDKCNGKILTTRYELRALTYYLKVEGEDFVNKGKGTKKDEIKKIISSWHYNECFINSALVYGEQCIIRSHFHK